MYCLRICFFAKARHCVVTLAGANFKTAEECEARWTRIPRVRPESEGLSHFTIDKVDAMGAVRHQRGISRQTAEALVGRRLDDVIAACSC